MTTATTPEPVWVYFENIGRVETVKYRTNADATHVEFWSEHRVVGVARIGWNRTKSTTVQTMARNALKQAEAATLVDELDVTPTWVAILPVLLTIFERGDHEGKEYVRKEMGRMARLADKWVAHHQETKA